MTRTSFAAVFAVLVALLAVAPVHADDRKGGGENAAEAVNRDHGASVFDLAFSVRRVAGDTVDETNTATAYASCETCQTVAIAIQVVLVTAENPDVVNPTNVSVAVNEECTTCATFAGAYQLVYGTGGPVRLTAAGRRQIALIRRELRELGRLFERGELTTADVKVAVTALTEDLRRVLDEELVPVRRGRGEVDDSDDREDAPRLDDNGRPVGEGGDVPAVEDALPPGLDSDETGRPRAPQPGPGTRDRTSGDPGSTPAPDAGDPAGRAPPSSPESGPGERSTEPDRGTTTAP